MKFYDELFISMNLFHWYLHLCYHMPFEIFKLTISIKKRRLYLQKINTHELSYIIFNSLKKIQNVWFFSLEVQKWNWNYSKRIQLFRLLIFSSLENKYVLFRELLLIMITYECLWLALIVIEFLCFGRNKRSITIVIFLILKRTIIKSRHLLVLLYNLSLSLSYYKIHAIIISSRYIVSECLILFLTQRLKSVPTIRILVVHLINCRQYYVIWHHCKRIISSLLLVVKCWITFVVTVIKLASSLHQNLLLILLIN
jgi:hypothetical protein